MPPRGSWDATAPSPSKPKTVGCSRQSVYDHAGKVKAAVEAEHGGGPTRAELVGENEARRQENTQLWDWLSQTIELPLVKLQEFAVTAVAMGLSNSQVLRLTGDSPRSEGISQSLDDSSLGQSRGNRRR